MTATTLIDGTITPRSFNDAHLWNPELRALVRKRLQEPELEAVMVWIVVALPYDDPLGGR